MPDPIYLDFNATTPIAPEVAEAMLPFLSEHFGNPSSLHAYGARTKRALERARREVADLIGARAEEIVFTSGGSESNNTVILGVARAWGRRRGHIVTTAIEHPAVIEPCRALEAGGWSVTYVPVDSRGRVDPEAVERAVGPETALVTVMHANNEVGTVQPIAEIAEITRRRGVLLHTDAAQSVGKIRVDVDSLGVDFLSIAGHKVWAPKGVGALYIRTGREVPPLIHGAGHESGRRAGTENVLEAVGLGRAASLASERLDEDARRMRARRDRLLAALRSRLGDETLLVNGDPDGGLPNTLSVSFPRVEATTLLAEVADRVAASAGAACHAGEVEMSAVLEAMGVEAEVGMGTVRFSVGRTTTEEEVDEAAGIVASAVRRLRPEHGGAGVRDAAPVGDGVRLTRFTHGMGCACKLRPQALEEVLRAVPPPRSPDVIVGLSTADDAAVYRVSSEIAVVETVDFFTPIADDPGDFGAIGAANALSDLYAMGATPRFALAIVAFPSARLPLSVLARILESAAEVAREAGIDIVGGHSVEDSEPKFGLAVTGFVHPDRVWTNAGARPADVLILTKPIGTGIAMSATQRGLASADLTRRAIEVMRTLNRAAADALADDPPHAATDVTGFGLLGHLLEMAVASGVDVEVAAGRVPILEGVEELAAADIAGGGSRANLEHVGSRVDWDEGVPRGLRAILADAQTSGGLLLAVPTDRESAALASLRAAGVEDAAVIGRAVAAGAGRVRVTPD